MKKTIFTIFSFILTAQLAFAGGIVTNTNQSASWVRMMARDASVDVDAVFFNPAGLTHLDDGFYFQLNSQTVSQSRTVSSTFPGLNKDTYDGKTFVPFLPTAFAVYKKGNLAISGGFTVIGGGGSAEFDTGLPMFEYPMILAMNDETKLGKFGVSKYSADINFKGSSTYLGFQGAISYKINDMISVALGARYISASNSYTGNIDNLSYNFKGGEMVKATDFFNGLATQLQQPIDLSQTAIDGGAGAATLDQLQGLGVLTEEQKQGVIGLLSSLGVPAANIPAMNITQINGVLVGAQGQFTTAAAGAGNKKLDVEQKGSGITPFISVDLDFGNLGFSAKYEMKTNMNVKTNVLEDNTGANLFIHDEEVPAEMPAMLALGARYNAGGLKLQTGFHYYFDKAAKYGKKNANGEFVTNGEETTFTGSTDKTLLSDNSIEFALGAQYDINTMFGLSAGFLMTKTNPNPVYQSSLSYSLSTKTLGFGAIVHATSKIDIDLGVSFTSYDKYEKDFTSFKETYEKTAKIFAIGATLKL